MLSYAIRFGKRFAVLLPGLLIAYVSVRTIFPYFDDHLPVAIALLATYILAAYVLIPALIRLFRVIVPASHLPLYCVTPDGFASDPINIGIVGTRQQLISAMEAAGWHQAAPHSLRNAIREGLCTVYGWSYPNAPMSYLYLFGRRQDIGFEIPIEGQLGSRHHVRFWAATYSEDAQLSARSIHWHNRQAHVRDDTLLWIGAASRDVGISYIRHNIQLTHMIDPDTNAERELLANTLQQAKVATRGKLIKLNAPYTLKNRAWRGYLKSDGQMRIVTLRR